MTPHPALVGDKVSYVNTIFKLNALQSNTDTIQANRNLKRRMNSAEYEAYIRNKTYACFERAQVTMDSLDALNVIHVAGTKGKGSTCAIVESILRNRGYKTGFFSSPHLVKVSERIRINGKPLSNEQFAEYFDVIHRRFENDGEGERQQTPSYFKFLTILAYHVFTQEAVDVAIMEVGLGGLLDATNVVKKPIVCGITCLDYDHINVLGSTLREIAYQKAGIMKFGVPTFTVSQQTEAHETLVQVAQRIGSSLRTAPDMGSYFQNKFELEIFKSKFYHLENVSLALQLVYTWLETMSSPSGFGPRSVDQSQVGDGHIAAAFPVDDQTVKSIIDTSWLGRNQVISKQRITYYLDGAHTPKSMTDCVKWFSKASLGERQQTQQGKKVVTVLYYNYSGDRDRTLLMEPLEGVGFDVAIFSPNVTTLREQILDTTKVVTDQFTELQKVKSNESFWTDHFAPSSGISRTFECVEDALLWISGDRNANLSLHYPEYHMDDMPPVLANADHVQCLICGSLYLVGGSLRTLMPEMAD